jgi:hypothetical protein
MDGHLYKDCTFCPDPLTSMVATGNSKGAYKTSLTLPLFYLNSSSIGTGKFYNHKTRKFDALL